MFVAPEYLPFDLAALIEAAITEWSRMQKVGSIRPESESCGDYIVAEMEALGIRRLDGDRAEFSAETDASVYRDAVFAALDKWRIRAEASRSRTPQEIEEYMRPLGE